MFVDLPGYGYARVSEEERQRWRPMVEQYLSGRENLKAVDGHSRYPPDPANADDGQLLDWLAQLGIPAVLAVTKCGQTLENRLGTSR